MSDTGSDFTGSVVLLEKKMSKMTDNVSIVELSHLVEFYLVGVEDLVRSSNLAHDKCVFFVSRDVSRRVLDVNRQIAFLRSFRCLALWYLLVCSFIDEYDFLYVVSSCRSLRFCSSRDSV